MKLTWRRILAEHPREEGYVLQRGNRFARLLSGLMLSRGFGDPEYSLADEETEE